MPKIAKEITKQLQVEANKGRDFSLGGIVGFKCDYRRSKPCYYLQWSNKGKREVFYIGNVSLKEARKKAQQLRTDLDLGINPNEVKRQQEQKELERQTEKRLEEERRRNTLKNVSEAFFQEMQSNRLWRAKDNGQREIKRFNSKILPSLGNLLITEITPQDVYKHFTSYWVRTPNEADKVYTRLKQVFDWAIAKGTYGVTSNPADKRGAFGVLIKPLTNSRQKNKNLPAPNYQRINELIRECLPPKSMSNYAFIFQVLTATRGEAVITLEWEDIDFNNAVAVIKPENDKGCKEFGVFGRPREIFLSRQVIDLLNTIPRLSKYVFTSREGGYTKHIRDGATREYLEGIHARKKRIDGIGWVDLNVLNKHGQPSRIVPHATARATFRTWAEENHKHEKASELCLLHLPKDIYGGAYKRGSFEKERREIMQAWSDFCLQEISFK